jgi:hypothetical protein
MRRCPMVEVPTEVDEFWLLLAGEPRRRGEVAHIRDGSFLSPGKRNDGLRSACRSLEVYESSFRRHC